MLLSQLYNHLEVMSDQKVYNHKTKTVIKNSKLSKILKNIKRVPSKSRPGEYSFRNSSGEKIRDIMIGGMDHDADLAKAIQMSLHSQDSSESKGDQQIKETQGRQELQDEGASGVTKEDLDEKKEPNQVGTDDEDQIPALPGLVRQRSNDAATRQGNRSYSFEEYECDPIYIKQELEKLIDGIKQCYILTHGSRYNSNPVINLPEVVSHFINSAYSYFPIILNQYMKGNAAIIINYHLLPLITERVPYDEDEIYSISSFGEYISSIFNNEVDFQLMCTNIQNGIRMISYNTILREVQPKLTMDKSNTRIQLQINDGEFRFFDNEVLFDTGNGVTTFVVKRYIDDYLDNLRSDGIIYDNLIFAEHSNVLNIPFRNKSLQKYLLNFGAYVYNPFEISIKNQDKIIQILIMYQSELDKKKRLSGIELNPGLDRQIKYLEDHLQYVTDGKIQGIGGAEGEIISTTHYRIPYKLVDRFGGRGWSNEPIVDNDGHAFPWLIIDSERPLGSLSILFGTHDLEYLAKQGITFS